MRFLELTRVTTDPQAADLGGLKKSSPYLGGFGLRVNAMNVRSGVDDSRDRKGSAMSSGVVTSGQVRYRSLSHK